jgi:hypothetical protein
VKFGYPAKSRSVAAFGIGATFLFAAACGGSEPEAKVATGKAAASDVAHGDSARETAEGEPEEKPPSAVQRCADGTCFACGAGYCPNGFYCDESAKGGASCSWLPTCAGKSGCGCLTRALGSCKCDDGQGGPHVRCE